MKPLLLTFDVEEFDWPVVDSKQLPIAEQTAITAEGLRLLLPLLAKNWACHAAVGIALDEAKRTTKPRPVRHLNGH